MPALIGNGDDLHGRAMLLAIREDQVIEQIARNGGIFEKAFKILYHSQVLAKAAQHTHTASDDPLKVFVDKVWSDAAKERDGRMGLEQCWNLLLDHDDLAEVLGECEGISTDMGKEMLLVIQEMSALDQHVKDGFITEAEFKRLYDRRVLANARNAVNSYNSNGY